MSNAPQSAGGISAPTASATPTPAGVPAPDSRPTPRCEGTIDSVVLCSPGQKMNVETELPTIPGYEILEVIGRGGMGVVYKARHVRLKRLVALKVILRDRLSANSDAIQRFQREALAAAQLFHPNVVVVFDSDQVGDTYFIAMEYVDGTDLHQMVKDRGPLPVEEAVDFIKQAAMGLQHAHECGLVHRDIKPSNLLVTNVRKGSEAAALLPDRKQHPFGVVKILDMGLALVTHAPDAPATQWTQVGSLMGTPDFIAPEQAIDSHAVDIRADLYSLGCSFYYLLTGKAPFGEHSLMKKLMMHQSSDPKPVTEVRPEVPAMLGAIIRKLMAKAAQERYQTPAEVVEALMWLSGPGSPAKPAPLPEGWAVAAPTPGIGNIDSSTVLAPVVPPKPVAKSDSTLTNHPCPTAQEPELPAGLQKVVKIACLKATPFGGVTSLAFSGDRATLISGTVDGRIGLWDMKGKTERDRAIPSAHTGDIHAVAVSEDNRHFASGSGSLGGTIMLWDYSGDQPCPLASVPANDFTADVLAFSPNNQLLAGAGSDKHVHIWDVSGETLAPKALLKGHGDFVRALAFASDSQTLASGSVDGAVRIWNLAKFWSKEQAVIEGPWGAVRSLAFAPGYATLAFGCLDQAIRIYDVGGSRPEPLGVLQGHLGVIRLVQFNRDGKSLVSICDGGRLIRWNLASGEKEREWLLPRGKVFSSLALTHDGRYLAAGDSQGQIYLFRLYPRHEEKKD